MVEQIIFSPEMKRSVIISNKDFKILGNLKVSGKPQNFIELFPSAQFSSRNENFVSASKNLLKGRN